MSRTKQPRGGGGGGNARSWEARQHQKVGLDAKAAMAPKRGESPAVGQMRAKRVIDNGERGMSISASKDREDPGGSKYWSNSRPVRPTK